MESRAPAVVAIVVTTGEGPGLESTLTSLVQQDYPEMSILVIANGGALATAERVGAVAPGAFVRSLEENLGFAAAVNSAAVMVEGSAFFLICHDDVRLDHDVVAIMVETAFRTNAGIVTPKVVSYHDPLVLVHVGQTCDRFGVVRDRIEDGEVDHGQQDLERDVFVAPGGVTLIRADLFRTLRGFDPVIPLLGEDLDLCWRAQVAGARVVVAPSARIAHRETISTGERPIALRAAKRVSPHELQRRHQLLVVASGWRLWRSLWILLVLAVMDGLETLVALAMRDRDRRMAILGSWRWLLRQGSRVRTRRRELSRVRVLSDHDLARLQVTGASRLQQIILSLIREGINSTSGIWPEVTPDPALRDDPDSGVGFAAAFSDDEVFDEGLQSAPRAMKPSRFLTSFRAQVFAVALVGLMWVIGSRNLLTTHLPLVGRLAPLDSWWSNWRHFFASWSASGVGSGAPGMPGYGVLAAAGTLVLGRMGILPRLALVGAVPLGALGVARLLKGRVSNRARIVAVVAYLVAPSGLNMIAQGRTDVLVVVSMLPFIVRRVFEVLAVPGFREVAYPAPVPFGHRGWRSTEAGQRMSLFVLCALASALAPATLLVVLVVVVSVGVLTRPQARPHRTRRLAGALITNVAILLAPLSVDTVLAGRKLFAVFGLPTGPWEAPSVTNLLRGVNGSYGATWWGWVAPGLALVALVLVRAERRPVVSGLGLAASVSLVLATVSSHHWAGTFTPDVNVLFVLYGLCLALLSGYALAALENDLGSPGREWRRVVAPLAAIATLALPLGYVTVVASGRFDLPTTSAAGSLTAVASSPGNRVLWLGAPSVIPAAGWAVVPGLVAATSTGGLPRGSNLFAPPTSATFDPLLAALREALRGQTVYLGQLLAPAGISTIVVMQSAAPQLEGVQSSPVEAVPGNLLPALNQQVDLSLTLSSPAVEVFSNAEFNGVVRARSSTGQPWHSVLGALGVPGTVTPGTTLEAGYAPASAFSLRVTGDRVTKSVLDGWAPSFSLAPTSNKSSAVLVMRRFPWNGILAGVTLLLWLVVGLGFGWITRFEWLFTGRQSARRGRSRG